MTLIRPPKVSQDTDVLIIGGGLAGMTAALSLYPLSVTLITPDIPGRGGSSEYAKGGIAASITPDDSPEQHIADTQFAGADLTEPSVAKNIISKGIDSIEWLEQQAVQFDRTENGKLQLGQEGAHSKPRIVHIKGDQTGLYMSRALAKKVSQSRHIKVIHNAQAHRLITNDDGHVCGALIQQGPNIFNVRSTHVILSTGGVGGLFRYTTNPIFSTGRGLALAARVGADLGDLEFIQFHPTALKTDQDPLPLMTEALRGAGCSLVDADGQRFMDAVSDLGDLAPRDIVANTLWQRQKQGQHSFLNGQHMSTAEWQTKFPSALQACLAANINPTTELIPVTPAAHYHMGGILTSTTGRSSVAGLWALGECACTGLHGANRLASNSLLEAVVVARQCAEAIKSNSVSRAHPRRKVSDDILESSPDFWSWLRSGMWSALGVERNPEELKSWLDALDIKLKRTDPHCLIEQDTLLTARMITETALHRQESRGGHYRVDSPHRNPDFVGRFIVRYDHHQDTFRHIWHPLETTKKTGSAVA